MLRWDGDGGMEQHKRDAGELAERCIAEWCRVAAEAGEPVAQWLLGTCRYRGIGIRCDDFEAAKWFRRAAKQGHADAQWKLGYWCYAQGRGVPRDLAEATRWYERAAALGYSKAQKQLLRLQRDAHEAARRSPERKGHA